MPSEEEIELERERQEIEALNNELNAPIPAEDRIAEMYKMIRELEREREAEKTRRYDLRQKKRRLEMSAGDLQSRIEIKREAERQAERMSEAFFEMDRLTENAKWRTGVEMPDGRVFKIMDHQLYAAHFLTNAKRAICADEMGLGKTIESIATLDMLGAKRVLIICPGEVMSGYAKEIKQWSPTRPVMVIGRKPKEDVFKVLDILRTQNVERFTLLINYESWARNKKLLEGLESLRFDSVIADEAHRIKETTTSAYKGVAQIVFSENTCQDCGALAIKNTCTKCYSNWGFTSSVENVLFLTGTPILNRPMEIWPLLHLINRQAFFSQRSFQRSFLVEIDQNTWAFQEGGMSRLAAQLQGFYIRRTLDDTDIVLPPQDVRVVELDLDPAEYPLQTQIIEMLREYCQIIVDDNPAIDIMSQLALITRQRQAAVWPGGIVIKRHRHDHNDQPMYSMDGEPIMEDWHIGDHFRESIKIDYTMRQLAEYIGQGRRVVIFTQFAKVIEEILYRCELDGIAAVGYYGQTSQELRNQVKEDFNRDKQVKGVPHKWDVVVCHYTTGGVGLNFTAATHMILTDEEWNPGKENQAFARINRIGQTEETVVEILRINDGIDTWLANLIAQKAAIVEGFNQENKTYAELNEILTRKPKAA